MASREASVSSWQARRSRCVRAGPWKASMCSPDELCARPTMAEGEAGETWRVSKGVATGRAPRSARRLASLTPRQPPSERRERRGSPAPSLASSAASTW